MRGQVSHNLFWAFYAHMHSSFDKVLISIEVSESRYFTIRELDPEWKRLLNPNHNSNTLQKND